MPIVAIKKPAAPVDVRVSIKSPRLARTARTLAILAMAGCAAASCTASPAIAGGARPGQSVANVSCRQSTPTTFMLVGEINDAMVECVAANFQDTTTDLILNSPGGHIDSALDIAAYFEGRRLRMRVENECNSACANYFIPLAGHISIASGAYIGLHGSIDQRLVDRVDARQSETLSMLAALDLREDAFAERNAIPQGWLLQREAGSGRPRGISGGAAGPNHGLLFVEERLLRTCFPNISFDPYQRDLERHWLKSFKWPVLIIRGFSGSGSMECVPPVSAT